TTIDGITFSANLPIDVSPPNIISATSTLITRPVTICGTWKELLRTPEREFAWADRLLTGTASPRKATRNAIHFQPTPFLMYYMGPPTYSPFLLSTRYFTPSTISEYFVAIPNRATIHIQKIAPGPPKAIATGTPTILAAPIVEASAPVTA